MRRLKKIKYDSIIFLALITVFIVLLKNDLGRLDMLNVKNKKINDNIVFEEKRRLMLDKKIKDLKNTETIERIARQKLCLIKAGESAYRIIDADGR